jgi:hypothetical protein
LLFEKKLANIDENAAKKIKVTMLEVKYELKPGGIAQVVAPA